MQVTSHLQSFACSEFVFHLSTDQVGVVTDISTAGIETFKTIRLAGGKFLAARAREFRPATNDEITKRHRMAASIRPLSLPEL
jgi:hypothetical protein